MSTELLTQSNIMFTLGLIGVGYTVIMKVVGPQKKSETNDLLMEQKANLLREETDRKFTEVNGHIATLTKQNSNHIHTIDSKVDTLASSVNQVSKDVVKLQTIIEERIPRKP